MRQLMFEKDGYRLGFTRNPSGGFNYTCLHEAQTVAHGWIAGYSAQEANSLLNRIVEDYKGKQAMKDTEAVAAIIATSQRFIAANQLEQCYEMLKELGVSDEQIRNFCGEYFVANTCGFGEDINE